MHINVSLEEVLPPPALGLQASLIEVIYFNRERNSSRPCMYCDQFHKRHHALESNENASIRPF